MDLSDTFVTGRRVAATGTLIAMSHAELAALVRCAGGTFVTYPRRGGLILVVGEESLITDNAGEPTQILRRAQKLAAMGYPVRILRESEFLEQMGMVDVAKAVHGLHSSTDLVRLLNIPGARLRRWIRIGLIRPVERILGLPFFDFRQVASAKRLVELLELGVTADTIRRGLKRIEEWLPPHESAWSQLARLEADGRALVRRNEYLVDDLGQQYFDFETDDHAEAVHAIKVPETADGYFDAAIVHEDAGDLERAAEQYRLGLEIEPRNAILHFNLANLCYARNEPHAAIDEYRLALESDPLYLEAWNNLGSVLLGQNQAREALRCLTRAIELNPTYADAHYNLALVMDRLGRQDTAKHHRELHQRFSSVDRLNAGRELFLRVISADATDVDG